VANNYFTHFFAPKNLTNMSKNLVFVIDISGSMEGQKVRQVNGTFGQLTQLQRLWLAFMS
jgi:Mg-chelatase subunit ChlD